MRTMLQYMLPLLLLSLLAACDIGGPRVSPSSGQGFIPQRTTNGTNMIVCSVDGIVQVYREVPTGIFDEDEIHASPYFVHTPTGNTTEWLISGDSNPKENLQTDINLAIWVDSPVVGVTYKLNVPGNAEYATGDQANEYFADTETSMLKFSRLDKMVAAGDFAFTAINRQNDSVHVIGYFDVRFDK